MLECRKVHFIGVGGVGMSGLAWVLARRGFDVSGSDIVENSMTRRLRGIGARICIGHDSHNLSDAELVIISSAIMQTNPELVAAMERHIPLWHRSNLLAEILNDRRGIAIAGTHGKTTTTSMTALMFREAGLDPTILIGAELHDMGGNAEYGQGEFVVAEADESDGSLLNLTPEIAVITNIEPEHLDYYRDFEHELDVFLKFAGQVKRGGAIVCSLDDYGCCRIIDCVDRPFITYSVRDPEADLYAADIELSAWSSEYMLIFKDKLLGRVHLEVPGIHNVSNSLAALAIGLRIGIDFEQGADILSRFHGASRRFQIKGTVCGVTVVDDYAHHPTEVTATLRAARKVASTEKGRVIALFQPHRYTRTIHLKKQFGTAFTNADILILTDIYSAGERQIAGVSGESIYNEVKQAGHPHVLYCPTLDEVEDVLLPMLLENDLVMTMGAGNIWTVGEKLLSVLRSRETKQQWG